MAIAPDGRIVFAGLTGSNSSMVVVTKPTGGLDVRFGNGGKVITDFTVSAVAFGPDGNILAAGTTTANGHRSFTIARYLSTGGTSLSPNQLFVAEVYPDLLERPVDAAGLAVWSSLLDGGASRAQV